ncbi:MAG: hypothetical protein AABZ15_11700 [Nitrospirota bacterium]
MSSSDQITLDLSEPQMTSEETAVWNVLRMCKGRELAILGPDIEDLTGIRYKQVQKVINGLRCHHMKLIGSGTFGYYLPQTREEMDAVTHYISHRAIMALHTISKLRKLSMDEVYGQAKIVYERAG